MWALINPDNDTVESVFPRQRALQINGVNYGPSIFRDSVALMALNIRPVRRVQLNAPEDNLGWTSASVYIVQPDHVRQEVTWTEAADAQDQRDRRTTQQAIQATRAKHAAFIRWFTERGFWSDKQVLTAARIQFETDYAQELADAEAGTP